MLDSIHALAAVEMPLVYVCFDLPTNPCYMYILFFFAKAHDKFISILTHLLHTSNLILN